MNFKHKKAIFYFFVIYFEFTTLMFLPSISYFFTKWDTPEEFSIENYKTNKVKFLLKGNFDKKCIVKDKEYYYLPITDKSKSKVLGFVRSRHFVYVYLDTNFYVLKPIFRKKVDKKILQKFEHKCSKEIMSKQFFIFSADVNYKANFKIYLTINLVLFIFVLVFLKKHKH